jgi:uncharacterized membrane protein YeaQ/YmgE (transglycosylase-associated protein family)
MVELLTAVIVGAIVGWLARQLLPGFRLDLLGDTLVGIAGALIGSLLFPRLHLHVGGGGDCVDYRRSSCCNRRSGDLATDRTTNRTRETGMNSLEHRNLE